MKDQPKPEHKEDFDSPDEVEQAIDTLKDLTRAGKYPTPLWNP